MENTTTHQRNRIKLYLFWNEWFHLLPGRFATRARYMREWGVTLVKRSQGEQGGASTELQGIERIANTEKLSCYLGWAAVILRFKIMEDIQSKKCKSKTII